MSDGLPEPDDWLEWVPPEIEQAMREPRFRRLTPTERIELHGRAPAAYLRRKPSASAGGPDTPSPIPTVPIPAPSAIATPPPAPPEPAEAPPKMDAGLAHRLAEVEGLVSESARSVDRRAERVTTMLARAVGIASTARPE